MIIGERPALYGDYYQVFFRVGEAVGTVAISNDRPTEMFLCDVYSGIPRQGHATKLLKEIFDFVNKREASLLIEAIWHEAEPGAIDNDADLCKFYEKAGARFDHMGPFGSVLYYP